MYPTESIGAYTLASGQVLPDVQVAYVSYGTLNARGDNAILITHGYTSGPSMLTPGHSVAEGSWAPMVGPGQVLDTDRYFIVCSNMLGSAFGTTGPRSINPATGRAWGLDFPAITLEDIVGVQHRLLRKLGVNHLRAVIGPSYGGWQALQWALSHPGMVDAIGSLCSGLRHPAGLSAQGTHDKLAQSPEWHGGRYYEHGGMYGTLLAMRRQTLQSYGLERLYADRLPDPEQRRAAMDAPCHDWATKFDPISLITLAAAAESFDVRHRLSEIRARTLFMVCTSDAIFPPDAQVRELLQQLKPPLRYVELDSPYGHMASGVECKNLEPDLRWLLGDVPS